MASLFLEWLYIDAPGKIVATSKQLVFALFHYFSINLLLQTLVEPWRHDARSFSGAPLRMWGDILMNNIISRFIGLFLRGFVIGAGMVSIFCISVGAILLLIAWYGLPLLLIASVLYGISLIGGVYA